MAAAGSLDELLNSKVDESAFSALVGTLEDQIYSGPAANLLSATSSPSTVISNVNVANAAQRAAAPVPTSSNQNGVQHGFIPGYDGNKSVSSSFQKGVMLTGPGLRTVSAHSHAGVIQTGHFPPTSQSRALSDAGTAVNKTDVRKFVQTSAPQTSVHTSSLTNSSALSYGFTDNGSRVKTIQNGRQMAAAAGNRIINVVPSSNAPTVIANKPGGMAGTVTPVGAAASALTSGVQVINVQQTRPQSPNVQKTLAPRIVLSQQNVNRTANPGQPITLQTLQAGLQNSGSGHILVRTENGQLRLLQLPTQGGVSAGATSTPNTAPTTTAAPKSYMWPPHPPGPYPLPRPPPSLPPPLPPGSIHPYVPHGYMQSIYKGPATPAAAPRPVPASAGSQPAPQQPPGAMAPDTAKLKCKNFLATLLRLAKDQPDSVAWNVRALIQSLIDAKLEPEAFTTRLQQELNSSPQPCLVPFLKKSLPFLRQSLYSREITIEGVKPPPPSALPTPLGTVPNIHSQPRQAVVSVAMSAAPAPASVVRRPTAAVAATTPKIVSGHPALLNVQPTGAKTARVAPAKPAVPAAAASVVTSAAVMRASGAFTTASRPPAVIAFKKDKRLNFKSSLESGQDDDINDVAAMGGVNLQEESQHIMGSTEYVGTQIRSVRDETFLPSAALQLKIRQIAMRHGLDEPGLDVVALVSHATQERLKSLLVRLSVIAEHRVEVIKSEPRYEVSRDVRGQLRFLEELDKQERKRHEETEREMLLRAAKSRSKTEDPEQAKLKAKAKEMQRVEMEEVRQREANITALSAIGSRKRPRLDGEPDPDGPTVSGVLTNKQIPVRPRVKRVNVRDLQVLLEREQAHQRSTRLYRLLAK